MRILLDTHVFLWAVAGSPSLKTPARRLIQSAEAVYVSSASIWEVAIKARMGMIDADPQALAAAIEPSGFFGASSHGSTGCRRRTARAAPSRPFRPSASGAGDGAAAEAGHGRRDLGAVQRAGAAGLNARGGCPIDAAKPRLPSGRSVARASLQSPNN